jgi:4-diphosphocytidyl-2-C-methyl-D-erythritol kinase
LISAEARARETGVATPAHLAVFSPAKINVYLRILGRRADGYHDLETVMLPLDFGDELTFELQPTGVVLECDDPRLPVDDSNLIVRAAKRLAERGGAKHGARIMLRKRTPLAAGLGGGSSNAATTLWALNDLWSLHAPRATLDEIAADLGSDINFFFANDAALCHGRGERVHVVPCRFSATILLVNPGFSIATKWAYASWAKAAETLTVKPPEVSLLLRALAEDDLNVVAAALFNSLEAPSVCKFPVLELLKDAMRDNGAVGALMSGSGATVFGLFADREAAERSARQIRAEFGPSTWTTVTRFRSVAR